MVFYVHICRNHVYLRLGTYKDVVLDEDTLLVLWSKLFATHFETQCISPPIMIARADTGGCAFTQEVRANQLSG